MTVRIEEPMAMSELDKLRHTAAHVMADAVMHLWPTAKLTIGPPIEHGFYYDFDVDHPFTDEDLAKIEAEMQRIVDADLPLFHKELTRQEAIELLSAKQQTYKLEILEAIPADEKISVCGHGEFADLCRGGHVERTGQVKAFKLLSLAGAYWRGDSKNKMLQRIYGTAFPSKKELDEHLKRLEEAAKRDHRKLGKELGLINFHPYAPGAAFWLPKGAFIYNQLSTLMRRLLVEQAGYVEVKTPLLFNAKLWETSGHWQHYRDAMFHLEVEEQGFGFKPMNCPSHMLIFDMELRSYRDLPLRIHDQGVLHRNEASGTLGGLTRVRQFSQDDAHIFLRPDQIEDEIGALLGLVRRVYELFGLTYEMNLSTRNPDKFLGEIEVWNAAEQALANALDKNQIKYAVQPHEAAFYGPKIDIQITDAIGRKWQCATIQLDYQLPERFDLSYIGEDSKKHRPVVVHRAIYGSFERFIAMLIEHYAGAFPVWLAPVQARLLVVSEKQEAFAREVYEAALAAGVRVELDVSNDKLGAKIRRAQVEKIPYMWVVGDREVQNRHVAVRGRDGKQLDPGPFEGFIKALAEEGKLPLVR